MPRNEYNNRQDTDWLIPKFQKHYKITKVAEMYGVSTKTIKRRIDDGVVKARKIGGSIVIPHSEIHKLLTDYH